MRASLSWLNHLYKAPPQHIITLEVKASTYESGRGKKFSPSHRSLNTSCHVCFLAICAACFSLLLTCLPIKFPFIWHNGIQMSPTGKYDFSWQLITISLTSYLNHTSIIAHFIMKWICLVFSLFSQWVLEVWFLVKILPVILRLDHRNYKVFTWQASEEKAACPAVALVHSQCIAVSWECVVKDFHASAYLSSCTYFPS